MSEVSTNQYQTVSVGEWIIASILAPIPIVGTILLFIWAFGEKAKPSKKTWARAMLVLMVVAIILSIVFYVTLSDFIVKVYKNMQS